VNTLKYQIVVPVKLEMQKKESWTAGGDERLTDGEVEEDKKKKKN
jgi:hypothetical protein